MLQTDGGRGKLAPTAFLVAGLLGVGSLAPVVRDALVASRLGASNDSDAYFVATYVMLMIVTVLVADSLTPASVVSLSSRQDRSATGIRLGHALLVAVGVLTVVSGLIALLADPLIRVFAPGFDDGTRAVAVDATLAVAPGIALLGLAWLVTAYLNAAGYFLLPAMITPIVAVGAAIPLIAGTRSPVIAAAGWTLGAGLALAVMLGWAIVVAVRDRERQPVSARIDTEAFRRLIPNAAPLLILVTITQSAEIVDRVIPSGIEVGALTTVVLAKKVMNLPHTVLIAAVGAVTLPFISRESGAGRPARAFVETINLALFFLLPVTSILVIARTEIVTVLYGRGAFVAGDVQQTADLLGMYALALIPMTLGVILQRSFSTIGRSWDPLPVYAVAIGGYIIGAWLGVRWIGLAALPLAFTLAQVGYVGALMLRLNRFLSFKLETLFWPTVLSLTAALAASLAGLSSMAVVPQQAWIQVAVLASVSGATYLLLVFWFRHPAARDLLASFGTSETTHSSRMRVGIDATYARMPNGTGRYLSALIEELDRRPDVELVRFHAPRIEGLPRFLRVPFNGGVHVIWSQLVLPIGAWRRQIDVLHTSMIGSIFAPCPQVVTVHDGLDFRPQWRPSAIWSAYVRSAGALSARRAAAVVTVSSAAALDIQRFFRVREEKIHVVWNGARHFTSDGSSSPVAGPKPGQYVLVVGSRARYKNHETAIAAVELVRERFPDIKLVLAGGGLEDLAGDRAWVHTPGRVSDEELGWLYEHAALCCVPSFHEGFGLPVVEALICGVPVVASDIPAMREVGRDAARFADPLSPAAFAGEMLAIIENPAAERARVALRSSEISERTWQRAAGEIVEIYTSVVDSGEDGQVWAPGSAS
ncbi:hypothetical protein BH23CHL2_BH23CHL2_28830 [soil metagenome]